MIEQIIQNGWLEARGVVGFYPANTVDHDDIELYADESKNVALGKLHTLRQQIDRE
jgi:5-methyltetrahydrofolate--homocysteine methyltransferase